MLNIEDIQNKIQKTFVALTSYTYPYGYESDLIPFLPKGYFKDGYGNFFYKIGESKTAFTCHLDTACKTQVKVNHVINGDIISTDGKSILGADDKAGMTVLLHMIENNVPGLYCFFIGEEVGCIGSGMASKDDYFKEYDRMISFDRRGLNSVITYQSSQRCCSEEFAKSLCEDYNYYGLNFEPDDTGVYTDSAEFTSVIPECTNISVGYYKEHTVQEHQDIAHLALLAEWSTKVEWEKLPTKRDPNKSDYKSSYITRHYHEELIYSSNSNYKKNRRKKKNKSTSYEYWKEEEDQVFDLNKINQKPRVFLNSLDNDITDNYYEKHNGNYYEGLKQLIFEDRITAREFYLLKDQYLNMDNPNDAEFAEYMESIL